jgi:hypothetical protein
MSDEQHFDPSGNTEAFQAFARRTAEADPKAGRTVNKLAVVIGAIATVIIAAAVVWYVAVR